MKKIIFILLASFALATSQAQTSTLVYTSLKESPTFQGVVKSVVSDKAETIYSTNYPNYTTDANAQKRCDYARTVMMSQATSYVIQDIISFLITPTYITIGASDDTLIHDVGVQFVEQFDFLAKVTP